MGSAASATLLVLPDSGPTNEILSRTAPTGFRSKLNRQSRLGVFSGGVLSSAISLLLMGWVLWALSLDSFTEAARQREIQRTLNQEVSHLTGPVARRSGDQAALDAGGVSGGDQVSGMESRPQRFSKPLRSQNLCGL